MRLHAQNGVSTRPVDLPPGQERMRVQGEIQKADGSLVPEAWTYSFGNSTGATGNTERSDHMARSELRGAKS